MPAMKPTDSMSVRTCRFSGCERAAIRGHGYCKTHAASPEAVAFWRELQAASTYFELGQQSIPSDITVKREFYQRFQDRLEGGDFNNLLKGSMTKIILEAAAAEHRMLELGAMRLGIIRLLEEEIDPSKMAHGIAHLANAITRLLVAKTPASTIDPDLATQMLTNAEAMMATDQAKPENTLPDSTQPNTNTNDEHAPEHALSVDDTYAEAHPDAEDQSPITWRDRLNQLARDYAHQEIYPQFYPETRDTVPDPDTYVKHMFPSGQHRVDELLPYILDNPTITPLDRNHPAWRHPLLDPDIKPGTPSTADTYSNEDAIYHLFEPAKPAFRNGTHP